MVRERDTVPNARRRRAAWIAALTGLLVTGSVGVPVVLKSAGTAATGATSGGVKIAYFDQWSIYQNAFYLKNLDTEGIASKLNFLIYDFENIDPTNLTCFENTKASDPDPAGENDPNAGDGAATRSPTTRSRSTRPRASVASPTRSISRSPATSTSSGS